MALCFLCEKRKPRRFCPGLSEEICAQCCGEAREVRVNCPLDCQYLRAARRHEHPQASESQEVPHADIEVTEAFLERNGVLFAALGRILLDAIISVPGACDLDAREALEAMIRTYRTLESGLYYETRPNNPIAAAIQQQIKQGIEAFRQQLAQRTGMHTVRDKDVLGVLVMFRRLEQAYNNGRPLSRAFIDALREHYGSERQVPASSPLAI